MTGAGQLCAALGESPRSEALLIAGVGSGLTAHGAAAGGADVLACYSTACYRTMGLPSALAFLPYDDANTQTRNRLPEVLAAAGDRPVLAGVGAHDPRQSTTRLLDEMAALGVAGVTNEPFVGMYQGDLRRQLEAAGLGYDREVALVKTAVAQGLGALGWAWTATEAGQMAAAGAQVVGAMLGVSAGADLGSEPTHDLDAGIHALSGMVAAARAENPHTTVVIHGGPLNDPTSVATALTATGADGYVAGSTAERAPAVAAIKETVAAFKQPAPPSTQPRPKGASPHG